MGYRRDRSFRAQLFPMILQKNFARLPLGFMPRSGDRREGHPTCAQGNGQTIGLARKRLPVRLI